MRLVKLCGDDAQDRVDWIIGIRGNSLTRASTEQIIDLGQCILESNNNSVNTLKSHVVVVFSRFVSFVIKSMKKVYKTKRFFNYFFY